MNSKISFSEFLNFFFSKNGKAATKLSYCFLSLIVLFQSFTSFSQQDCAGAIPVCQQTYVQPNSYSGFGNSQEIFNTCLLANEQASVWYVFTVQTSGTFFFNINTSNDYDWALYELTGTSCANIPNMTPVRCNYSATYGNTGLVSPPSVTATLSNDASNSPTMSGLNVTAGQTFALIVDNYTQDQNGYTLSFSGTATFIDNTSPTFTTNTNNCYGNYVTITLSENVSCASIAANGSDFQFTSGPGSPTIVSAVGVGCPGSGTTNQVQVYYNATSSGQFTIASKVGNDGNTLLDRCGNALQVGQTATFNHLGTVTASASPSAICSGASTTLTVTGPTAGGTYAWSNGATTTSTTVSPTATTTYTVTVSYGGCTKTTSTTVTVSSNPVVTLSPLNQVLCSGSVDLTATSQINGVSCSSCNYNWNSGAFIQSGVPSSTWTGRGIGSYTLTVTTSAGCTGTASTSVSGPSANPAACNVVFASPTGVGTGLTANSPTNIVNAVNLAACNNAIVKLTVGTYTINNPLDIFTAMTLEGGYSIDFSSKTSSAGATTINRSALNVQGLPDAGRLVALQALNASYFRLQDLTITTVAAPASTTTNPKGISTYGLYLTNCNDYNIVRCQILPGAAGAGLGDPNTSIYNADWDGQNGGTGSNGGVGGAGESSCDCCGWFCDDPCDYPGNVGAGGTGGSGGLNATFLGGSASSGTSGGNGGNGRDEGSGSNGFSGSAGSGGCSGAGGSGGSADGGDNDTPYGGTGGTGGTGSPGTDGVQIASSLAGGFYNPSNGTDGTVGTNGCGGGGGGGAGRDDGDCDSAGGSGSGGGGGGGAGGRGRGAGGGGSSYGIFLNNCTSGGVVDDSNIAGGAFGAEGKGGKGGFGGSGGTSQIGNTSGDGQSNRGGAGGAGGVGGKGGNGSDGGIGESIAVKYFGTSVPLVVSDISFPLAGQPTINVSNIGCTNTNLAHSSAAGSPSWSIFGVGSSPSSGSGSPVNTQYSSTGRKDVVMNNNTYTGFNNILIAASLVTPAIVTASTTICAGTAGFSSSTINQSGLTYSWSVSNPSGGSSTIANASSGSTNITFTNTGTTNLTFTVSLSIVSSCCGTLGTVTLPIVVQANPILSAPTSVAVCLGGNASFTSTVTGTSTNGQWQVSNDGGTNWSNISASGVYSNVTTTTLSITGVTAAMNNLIYRYTVQGPCGTVASSTATLTINTPPTATISASPTNVCTATSQTSTLTFTFTGSAPWTVTYNRVTASGTTPFTFTTSSNPHTISVTPTADVSYNITSVYTVAGCANTTPTSTSINVTTVAPTVVLSASSVSSCGNVNLTTLVLPPPTSTLDGPLTYSPTTTPTAVGTGSYTISNTNACGTSTTNVSVTVTSLPTVSLPASQTVCVGSSVNLAATVSLAGGTYLWSPGGQTTSSISVSPGSTTTYGVTYTTPGCTPVSASTTVTVRPTPSAFISGTTSVCRNATQPAITFTNPNLDAVLVSYNINGGSTLTIGVSGNSTATVNAPTTTAGTFVYTITAVQFQSGTPNCSVVQTGSATITVTPLPTVTISGGTTVCQNASSPFVTFTNSNTTEVIASYTVNGSPATITVPAGSTATVGVNTSTGGTITYALTSVAFNTVGGCTGTASGTAIFTIIAAPTVTISGTTSVCQGASTTNISINNLNSVPVTVTYNLTGNPNQTMVINSGATGTIPVSTATTGVFTYNLVSVTLNGGGGCTASLSSSATVTVIQTPSVTISGNASVCIGSTPPTVTFTNFSSTAVSVNYSIGSNPNTITIPASGTNTVTAPTSTAGNLVYTLESASFTSGSACSSPVSGSITVSVLPLPTATLFGSETVCLNATTTGFTITNPRPNDEQVTYTFTGGSPQTVSISANSSLTIFPSSATAGTFTYSLTSVSYTNYSTCTSTLTGQTATLTVLPAPIVTISGTTSLCVNGPTSTVTFTNPSLTNAIVVNYNLNGGASTQINVSANATSTVTVSTTVAGTFSYNLESVSYVGSNTCSSPATGSATVVVNPLPTGSISGTATVCQGDVTNVTFTNTSNSEVVMTYVLGGVNGTVIVPANGTNTVAVPTGTAGIYTYNLSSIAYTSGSACTQSASGTAIVTVNPAPTATLTTSVTSACQNATSPTVSINNPQALPITVNYTIFDGTTLTGPFSENVSGNNSVGLPVPTTTALTYTYSITSVSYQSGGGCTNTGVTSIVTMEITAPPTITNTAVNVCSGTALNIPLTSNPGGATYEWNATNNINVTGETVASQTTGTITDILTATSVVSVTYNVIPTLNGCAGTASTIVVTVNPPPTAPIIGTVTHPTCATPTGTVALSGLPAAGTWTVNGNPSGSATGTGTTGSVSSLAAGNYTFTVTNAVGCTSPASASVTVNAAPSSLTTPTISGPNVCVNDNANFIISNLPIGTTITYNINGGASQSVLTTSNPFTITVNTVTANQTLNITNLISGTCTITLPPAFTISVNSGCVGFNECELIVFKNGNGSTSVTTSTPAPTALPVTIEQVNKTTGAVTSNNIISGLNNFTGLFDVNTGPVSGINFLTTLPNQPTQGFLNSYNGQLTVPGVNINVGTGNQNSNPKVVNIISSTGSFVNQNIFPISGSETPYFSTQLRSVIPGIVSGSFYCSGGPNPSVSGVWYYNGLSNYTQICNSTVALPTAANFGNIRNIEIFNGELYVTSGSNPAGIYKIGNGLPTTSNQLATSIVSGYANASPYGFSISPDGCTAYIADDGGGGGGGSPARGILKFSKSNGVWTQSSYKYPCYARGLIVDYSGTFPKIYATIAASNGVPCNQVIAVEDNGSSMTLLSGFSNPTLSNYRYSGIDFTPNSYKPITITTQPQTIAGCAGSIPPLTVVANSSAPLTYEWFRRAANDCGSPAISQGAPSSSPDFTPTIAGFYFVKIVASCASVVVSNTVEVTISQPPTATLTSATFCVTSSTPTSLTLTTTGDQTGATWSADAGLVGFNTTTGEFTPSASAVSPYTVTYTIPAANGCPEVIATGQVTIATSPTASISYTGSPFCSSAGTQTVNLTGDIGGNYTSTPAGLSISSLSGTITPSSSTGGTYNVTYTIPAAGGCLEFTSPPVSVTITQAPTATISYNGPFCLSNLSAQNVNLTGTAGGSFTVSPSGLSINASTGAITPNASTAGTYTVTYTLPAANGCPIFTTTATITISSLPNVTAALSSTTSCNGGTLTLTGGPASMTSYSWTGPTGVTFSPNAFTQSPSVTMGATGGTFTLTATDAGGCTNTATTSAVTINPSPTVTVNCNPICVGGSTIISATPSPAGPTYNYVWTVPSGATNPGNVQSFTTGTTGTYSVVATNTTTTCPSIVPSSCTITVYSSPSIIFLSPP